MAKTPTDPIQRFLDEVTRERSAADVLKDGSLLKVLKKRLIEAALEAEMTEHPGYEKHAREGDNSGNSRNGRTSKRLLDGDGSLEIEVPRDRGGEFEPQLVPKRQVRLPGFDEKVLALYSRGLTTRQIQDHLLEIYGTEISPALISRVTDAVLGEVTAWQNRPLEAVYPVVFLDALHVKVRRVGRVRNRAGAGRGRGRSDLAGRGLRSGLPRSDGRARRAADPTAVGGVNVGNAGRADSFGRVDGSEVVQVCGPPLRGGFGGFGS